MSSGCFLCLYFQQLLTKSTILTIFASQIVLHHGSIIDDTENFENKCDIFINEIFYVCFKKNEGVTEFFIFVANKTFCENLQYFEKFKD